jgi:hypothetical protein
MALQGEYVFSEHEQLGETRNAALSDELRLTDFLADRFAVAGTPDECLEKVRIIQDAGVDNLLILAISMGWPILAYFVAGVLLNKKPPHLYTDQDESKYWQRVRQNPKRTAREIRAKMKDVDRRLAEVETFYVSSNPRLNAEIERLR